MRVRPGATSISCAGQTCVADSQLFSRSQQACRASSYTSGTFLERTCSRKSCSSTVSESALSNYSFRSPRGNCRNSKKCLVVSGSCCPLSLSTSCSTAGCRSDQARNHSLCQQSSSKPNTNSNGITTLCVQLQLPISHTHTTKETIIKVDEQGEKEDREHALLLQIGGDSLIAISSVVLETSQQRPVALDLLWKVLERGQEISKREWKLIRVAIVDIKNSTYIGRLFFGDKETGEVVWDCDCRPSDGLWLSHQAKCPMYVHRRVWRDHKSRTRDLVTGDDETARFLLGPKAFAAREVEDLTGTKALTTIRQDDPEPVKRLKREMEVALSEEDYSAAARIRDHPFMKLAMQIVEERLAGRDSAAEALQVELHNAVKRQQ